MVYTFLETVLWPPVNSTAYRMVKQSRASPTDNFGPSRTQFCHLVEVFPYLSRVRLHGPPNLRSSASIQLLAILSLEPPGQGVIFVCGLVKNPVLSAVRSDTPEGSW